MKNLFITLACMWLTCTILLVPLFIGAYDGKGELGETYFRFGNQVYCFGYIGDAE